MIKQITGKSGEHYRVYIFEGGGFRHEWRHQDDPELREFVEKEGEREWAKEDSQEQ